MDTVGSKKKIKLMIYGNTTDFYIGLQTSDVLIII